jgi:hypothetical protein
VPRRKELRNALRNFAEQFASRGSDYQGYWLLGQLPPEDWSGATYDLMQPVANDNDVGTFARRYPAAIFKREVLGIHLPWSWVKEATLELKASEDRARCWQGDHRTFGKWHSLEAAARTDLGREFRYKRWIGIAVHDPSKERRRSEERWGKVPADL